MFRHALVACLDQTIPNAPLLSTVFATAHQVLGCSCWPFKVDQGLIYYDGMTALVRIKLRKDGSILWELASKLNYALLIPEIKCMKKRWYQRQSWFQTLDLEMLQLAPALIR